MDKFSHYSLNVFELLKKNFRDSCSHSMHDLKQRRNLIDTYTKHLKNFDEFLNIEDESLKNLEDKS